MKRKGGRGEVGKGCRAVLSNRTFCAHGMVYFHRPIWQPLATGRAGATEKKHFLNF